MCWPIPIVIMRFHCILVFNQSILQKVFEIQWNLIITIGLGQHTFYLYFEIYRHNDIFQLSLPLQGHHPSHYYFEIYSYDEIRNYKISLYNNLEDALRLQWNLVNMICLSQGKIHHNNGIYHFNDTFQFWPSITVSSMILLYFWNNLLFRDSLLWDFT